MTDSQDGQRKEGLLEKEFTRRALLGGMALGGAAAVLGATGPASAAQVSRSLRRANATSKMIGFSQPIRVGVSM